MAKGRATRDVTSDERWNEMIEQRDKKDTKWNQQTVEPSSSYEKSIEVRSPETKSWKPRRAETIDGKLSTRKTTSMKSKL